MAQGDIREVLDGVLHWTTMHEGIGARVSSYFVTSAGVVIDPRVPEDGLGAVASYGTPEQVVLTTGLHARHAEKFADAFDCRVRATPEAAERIGDELDVEPMDDGDEVAPGITVIEIGALAPDETALHIAVEDGAIVLADAVMHYGDALAFVPDSLMGDDPDRVKDGLLHALRGILTRDFDHLLFAHGDPLIGGGKAALRNFVEAQPVTT